MNCLGRGSEGAEAVEMEEGKENRAEEGGEETGKERREGRGNMDAPRSPPTR